MVAFSATCKKLVTAVEIQVMVHAEKQVTASAIQVVVTHKKIVSFNINEMH